MIPPPASDTIVAPATPPGRGALALLRLSGPEAKTLAERLFISPRRDFTGLKPYRLHFGRLTDPSGRVLDEVMAAYLPGPRSFTGQDTVEVTCHGGPAVTRSILTAFLSLGARLAGPGEFTRRAFMNGRLDLSQAEAVCELIAAEGRGQADLALARLDGGLGRAARDIRRVVETLRAGVSLAVDFPEEETDCLPPSDFGTGVGQAISLIDKLLAAFRRAEPMRRGARLVLFGRVNAGKSRLFNALLGRERAIVADAPGTTRDYLEESLDLAGLTVRLTDTAGLRETRDAIEQAGRLRAVELVREADQGLLVIDGSLPFAPDDEESAILAELGPDRVLAVVNKSDLPRATPDPADIAAKLGLEAVEVSAATGAGLEGMLTRTRARLLSDGPPPGPSEAAPNAREAAALVAAREELVELGREIEAGMPYDILGARLDQATRRLCAITGEITTDEVLNAIFERFCIGK